MCIPLNRAPGSGWPGSAEPAGRIRDRSDVDATAGVEPATLPGMNRSPGPPGSPRCLDANPGVRPAPVHVAR